MTAAVVPPMAIAAGQKNDDAATMPIPVRPRYDAPMSPHATATPPAPPAIADLLIPLLEFLIHFGMRFFPPIKVLPMIP